MFLPQAAAEWKSVGQCINVTLYIGCDGQKVQIMYNTQFQDSQMYNQFYLYRYFLNLVSLYKVVSVRSKGHLWRLINLMGNGCCMCRTLLV